MTKANPESFIEQCGLTKEEVDNNFELLSLALQLNGAISHYIDSIYDLCLGQEESELFYQKVAQEAKNMGVGSFYQEKKYRPIIKNPD